MPIYQFKCGNGHIKEIFKKTPYQKAVRKRCEDCGLWLYRDYQGEHSTGSKTINLSYDNDPLSHLTRKRSFKGRWIENLTPEPVFIRNEKQYQKLLKDTNSREKIA